jgi:hypothetical protein
LDDRIRRWLDWEQTVNERLAGDASGPRLRLSAGSVSPGLLPEHRQVRPQQVVWLPRWAARSFGPLEREMRGAFGLPSPNGRVPFFIHPQPPAAHRRLIRRYGVRSFPGVGATTTSSYRTVLAWRDDRPPRLLKLSMGARVGTALRSITEYYLVTGIMVSMLLDTIPPADRRRLALDWFAEPAGVVDTASGTGWILRRFPRMMTEPRGGDLIPLFSLLSPLGIAPPLLVRLITESGLSPERFVLDCLIAPYVRALAHLLFVEGIQLQGHAQNVLVELKGGALTGRTVVRDLTDSSVSVAMRLARRKPLPVFAPGESPARMPFPIIRSVIDYSGLSGRRVPVAARDTVEQYGLRALVWSINTSLARYFRGYRAARVELGYLELWQEAARELLGVEPEISRLPWGLATDEALAWYLEHADWKRAGAVSGAQLSRDAEPLPSFERLGRKRGRVYGRVDCAWGELYLDGDRPVFFRPAF